MGKLVNAVGLVAACVYVGSVLGSVTSHVMQANRGLKESKNDWYRADIQQEWKEYSAWHRKSIVSPKILVPASTLIYDSPRIPIQMPEITMPEPYEFSDIKEGIDKIKEHEEHIRSGAQRINGMLEEMKKSLDPEDPTMKSIYEKFDAIESYLENKNK